MSMEITFPGGLAVEAHPKGFTIATDQPVAEGGGGSAPSPFDLFLASIGTCAGLYVLRFCRQRGIDTTGLGLSLATEREGGGGRVSAIRLELRLPAGFPDKYREAIVRAADQCAVKRHIFEPPRFEVVAVGATFQERMRDRYRARCGMTGGARGMEGPERLLSMPSLESPGEGAVRPPGQGEPASLLGGGSSVRVGGQR